MKFQFVLLMNVFEKELSSKCKQIGEQFQDRKSQIIDTRSSKIRSFKKFTTGSPHKNSLCITTIDCFIRFTSAYCNFLV